jgi:hypothetical protein
MSSVWTFGDSFTEGFKSEDSWAKTYVEWKGYVPLTYGEIISNKLNYEIINLGKSGFDNYSIFETFCKNIKKIKDNDIVIIGWSDVGRFRLSNENEEWKRLLPNTFDGTNKLNNISQNTIDEILVNRLSNLYVEEVNSWIELIKMSSNNFKVINWSTFNKGEINGIFVKGVEKIKSETKGVIDDGHFSENGQKQLSEILFMEINNCKKMI